MTVWALFFNGLILGVIGGLAVGAGNGVAFLRLISSHGPLEISCIVVGGIAGLRMGWALVRPGSLRRSTSLRREAIPAVEMAAGTVPWLVLCGFLEGFATGPELPVAFQASLGGALFVLFWGLVVWRGRGGVPSSVPSGSSRRTPSRGPAHERRMWPLWCRTPARQSTARDLARR